MIDDSAAPARKSKAMKPLKDRLQAERERLGLPEEVLERDYIMSWVLAGIASVPSLKETLVLNGSAALRKSYFRDYRFSEDMDFTAVGEVPTGADLEEAIRVASKNVVKMLRPYAPVEIACEPRADRHPPGGKRAFEIRVRLPWQRKAQTEVTAQITLGAALLTPCASRSIEHGYGEPLQAQVLVCSLDEIVAEKLRAILEHASAGKPGAALHRALDYYDLWRILGAFEGRLDVPDFPALLREKCKNRHLSFQGPESFFPESLLPQI